MTRLCPMLTVQNLINIDLLKLEAVAGLARLAVITWAHTVDLPDPWRWVSPGDLVMTTGVGLPFDAEEQVVWLEKLVQSNASALVVVPRHDAPPLSQALLDAADRLLFPVLRASFDVCQTPLCNRQRHTRSNTLNVSVLTPASAFFRPMLMRFERSQTWPAACQS